MHAHLVAKFRLNAVPLTHSLLCKIYSSIEATGRGEWHDERSSLLGRG